MITFYSHCSCTVVSIPFCCSCISMFCTGSFWNFLQFVAITTLLWNSFHTICTYNCIYNNVLGIFIFAFLCISLIFILDIMMSCCLCILRYFLRTGFYRTTCCTTIFCKSIVFTSRCNRYCLISMRITSYMFHIQSFYKIGTPHEFLVIVITTLLILFALEIIFYIITVIVCLLCRILIYITIICRNRSIQLTI